MPYEERDLEERKEQVKTLMQSLTDHGLNNSNETVRKIHNMFYSYINNQKL